MKKYLCILMIALICLMIPASAMAYVSAIPNQKLAFRTGPNTKYAELYSMPRSTSLTAIEYEEGNGVTWVLVEFWKDGGWVRAYTGLKRMEVQGALRWASHQNTACYVTHDENVISGPGTMYTPRGEVDRGDAVTLLRYEYDYAYIEFYDDVQGAPSRGYVPADAISEVAQGDNSWLNNIPEWIDVPEWNGNSGSDSVELPDNVMAGIPMKVSCRYFTPLLESPDPYSYMKISLYDGNVVTGYGYTDNGYAFVEYSGTLGYVDRSCLILN